MSKLIVGAWLTWFALCGSVVARAEDARPGAANARKTYVIVGASSGFGRGVAVKLGGRGGNVVLAARRAGVLEDVARELGHRISPDLTTRLSANIYHRETVGKGMPAPASSGSLYRPMAEGQGVEGGVRARMREEDAQRRRE